MGTMQDVRATMAATRRSTWLVVIVMVIIPMLLLILRWEDPSRGQIPFGWQMHTVCWGASGDPQCAAP